VEHAYAFSCAASASGSCLAASVSRIRLLENLSGFKARCVGTPFCSSLHRLVTCYGAKGAPIHVSGRVWVEWLEPEIMLLTDVSEAIVDLVVITWGALRPQASVRGGFATQGATNPQALACARAVVVPGPQGNEVASPPL
jgi:hypothetical protein